MRLTTVLPIGLSIALVTIAAIPHTVGVRASHAGQTSAASQTASGNSKQDNAIKLRVGEVIVPVVVTDRKGEAVLNLSQNDFHIYDNGAEKKIEHFDVGGGGLSVALVIETSDRVEALLPAIRRTGIIFTGTAMVSSVDAAVINFDNSVNIVQNFTSNDEEIQRTIEHLRAGDSGAKLYDALSRGVMLLNQQSAELRRILIVVAEAIDKGSSSKIVDVLQQAELANVTIYSIGLSTTIAQIRGRPKEYAAPPLGPEGTQPFPTPNGYVRTPEIEQETRGNIDVLGMTEWLVRSGLNAIRANALVVASRATGGLHINTTNARSIEVAMDKVGGELTTPYMLAYSPGGEAAEGYHQIRVEVGRSNLTVRTRPGYYLAPSSP